MEAKKTEETVKKQKTGAFPKRRIRINKERLTSKKNEKSMFLPFKSLREKLQRKQTIHPIKENIFSNVHDKKSKGSLTCF